METQKLDWSKLGEMPPYAPTGPGRYLFSNGAIETIRFNDLTGTWQTDSGFYLRTNGYTYFNHLRVVAPAPDVLPWEECEQLEGLLVHANREYASLLEACEADRQARLKLVEECERLKTGVFQSAISCGLTPADGDTATGTSAEELDKQLRAVLSELDELQERFEALKDSAEQYLSDRSNLHVESKVLQAEIKVLKAERDELQNKIAEMLGDYKTLKAKHDVLDAGMRAASIVTLLEREKELTGYIETLQDRVVQSLSQISDLQQRVAKLEEFKQLLTRSFACFKTMPQAIEPLPAVTDAVQAEKEVAQ